MLNTSSLQNRNLLISLLLYTVYLIVITASITHIDIVFNLEKKIPILGLKIKLSDFYIFAPILLLMFHINLIYNLTKHMEKLKISNIDNSDLYPYIVNFAYKNGWLVQIFAFILIFGFANLALIYLWVALLPLKSEIWIWHIFLISIDFIGIYWTLCFIKNGIIKIIIISLYIILLTFNFIYQKENSMNSIIIYNTDKIYKKTVVLKNLTSSTFVKFDGDRLDFDTTNLKNSTIESSIITNSVFSFVDFDNSTINDVDFSGGTFYQNNFDNSIIKDVNFKKSKFKNVSFKNADIQDTDFQDSTFYKVDFNGTSLSNINLCGSKMIKVKARGVRIKRNVKCFQILLSHF